MLSQLPLGAFSEPHDENPSADLALMLDWLSGRFRQLETEGLEVVDEYWRALKDLQKGRAYWPRMTLGLRMRTRPNGSISLEWYGMGVIGRDKRPVERIHIAKGRHHAYPIKSLLRRQPTWIAPLVEQSEILLSDIRCRQDKLTKIRDALGDFARSTGECGVTGSKLLERHRLDQQLKGLL